MTENLLWLKSAKHHQIPPSRVQVMSEANAERLANALCRMRGAALKLGQVFALAYDAVMALNLNASALASS